MLTNLELERAVESTMRWNEARKAAQEQARSERQRRRAAEQQAVQPTEVSREGRGVTGFLRDTALGLGQGAIAVPEALVGLADIPTGGYAGKAVQGLGIRFADAKDFLGELKTPQFHAAQREFEDAEGFAAKAGAALANPSLIVDAVAQSVPSIVAGGAVARGLGFVGKAGKALSPAARAALGEGAVMAGQQAEGIRQQSPDGLLSPKQSGAAVATGALGAGFGFAGGKLAQRLGVGDVDTMLAQGAVRGAGGAGAQGLPRKLAQGAATEGVLEELPQSVSEQVLQNWALDRPLDDGVDGAAAMGLLAGGAMGAGGAGVHHFARPAQSAQGPLEEAAAPLQLGYTRQIGYKGAPSVDDVAPSPPLSQQLGIDPAHGPLSKAAAVAVDSGASGHLQQRQQQEEVQQVELQRQQAVLAERQRLAVLRDEPPVVLQNRDRSAAASVLQMQAIAAKPDYLRVGQSAEMQSGAPLVFEDADVLPAHAVVGDVQPVVNGDGERLQTRYAVVEAADLLPSHFANGRRNADYENGEPQRLRPVAGNGRAAGLIAAYERGAADGYRRELMADAPQLGMDASAIEAMQRPVLVRVMARKDMAADVADVSNTSQAAVLSPVEQAVNDARRVQVVDLAFDDVSGLPSPEALKVFVQGMPQSERAALMNPDGSPTRQASERMMGAAFQAAYGNEALTRLFAQAQDPEAKVVINALAAAAPDVAKTQGGGDFDVREAIAQAGLLAVNAKRRGLKLADVVKEGDFDVHPDAATIAGFMARNIRRPKFVAKGLRSMAQRAQEQIDIIENNAQQDGMFGPQPVASRADVLGVLQQVEDAHLAGRKDDAVRFARSAPESVQANIQRGREAMQRAVAEKADQHRAMFRQGLGWVDFVWGDDKKGIAHVIKQRHEKDELGVPEIAKMLSQHLVETIAQGETARRVEAKGSVALHLDYDGYRAIVVKNPGSNAWMLTGFEKKTPVERREGFDSAPPTQTEATPTRNSLGAGKVSLPQSPAPSKPAAQQKHVKESGVSFTQALPHVKENGVSFTQAAPHAQKNTKIAHDVSPQQQWDSLPVEQRQALLQAAQGLNKLQKAHLHKRHWDKLGTDVQGKLAATMQQGDVGDEVRFARGDSSDNADIMQRAKNTIRQAIAAAKHDKQHNERYALLPVTDEQAKQAAKHGLDVSGYKHIIDSSAIRHTFKNHGNPRVEQARGQIAVTDADLESIPDILSAPDDVLYGLKNKIGREVIGYLKHMPDGTTVYLEKVRDKHGTLATQSMWRFPLTVHASSIKKALRHTSTTLQRDEPSLPQPKISDNTSSNDSDTVAFPNTQFARGPQGKVQPVANITGEEIAPRSADLPTLRAAAKEWYEANLRGRTVTNEASGREVIFAGSRKAISTSANPDKLRLFAALEAAVHDGEFKNSKTPKDPSIEGGTKAYHWLEAMVSMDGKPATIGVTVREDINGNFYYNHNAIEKAPESTRYDPAHKAGVGIDTSAFARSISESSDDINLHIIEGQGNRLRIMILIFHKLRELKHHLACALYP